MANKLRQTARAYRQSVADEEAAKKTLAEATARRKALRESLAAGIVAAAKKGTRQVDILDEIEHVYTRESVRRICRAAGVEPGE